MGGLQKRLVDGQPAKQRICQICALPKNEENTYTRTILTLDKPIIINFFEI
jgi:hypothetical protein